MTSTLPTVMIAAITNHWPTIIVAWVLGTVIIGGYALFVVRRGRRLSREVPPGSRRWIRS